MSSRVLPVTDETEIRHILDTAKVLHLGLSENGFPYVLAMNYGYTLENGRLTFYLHSAGSGHKLQVIDECDACCVQLECDEQPFPGKTACQYGWSFRALTAFGRIRIVKDPAEKTRAMAIIMKTQTGKEFEFTERLVSIVSVMRIDCDSFTACHRPIPPVQWNGVGKE